MAPGNTTELKLQRGDETAELSRLRRELEEVRTRLDEETAYYRAEIEASRQRLERDSTRLQADEVARRRRIEEQLITVKAELREARQALDASRQREEQLAAKLAEAVSIQEVRIQQAVEGVQTAASAAWEEAEQELTRRERELKVLRQLLSGEQQGRKRLEATLARAEEEAVRARQAEQDAMRLVGTLKKALWATAQARRQAEAALHALHSETAAESIRPAAVMAAARAPVSPAAEPASGLNDGVHEISETTLKSIFFGELSDNLADDFLLTPSDASLDPETVDRLRTLPPVPSAAVAPVSPPAPTPKPKQTSPEAVAPPSAARGRVEERPAAVAPPPAHPAEPVLGMQAEGMRRLLRNLTIGAVATGGLYWLLIDGNGQRLLAALAELLP